MYDRIERRGATRYAEALAGDFEDGVRSRVAQVIPGSDITVVEAWLDSPPDQPLHCPPGAHPDPLPPRRPDVADRLALRAAARSLRTP